MLKRQLLLIEANYNWMAAQAGAAWKQRRLLSTVKPCKPPFG